MGLGTALSKLVSAEVRQTIHIHCTSVNMATCVTFICLKAYEKLQVFYSIFSKGGSRKNRNMAKRIIEEIWLELGRQRETLKLRQRYSCC